MTINPVANYSRRLLIVAKNLLNDQRNGNVKAMGVTRALAALKPLFGKSNIEIITTNGTSVRGTVLGLRAAQAFTTPSVQIEGIDGTVVGVPFTLIRNIVDYNN